MSDVKRPQAETFASGFVLYNVYTDTYVGKYAGTVNPGVAAFFMTWDAASKARLRMPAQKGLTVVPANFYVDSDTMKKLRDETARGAADPLSPTCPTAGGKHESPPPE